MVTKEPFALSKLDESTALAVERTRVAYERTMLAWVRTAISLITFGFAIAKFSNILRPTENVYHVLGAPQLGFIMVCLGVASLVLAVFEYRRNIHDLGSRYANRYHSSAVILAGLVGLLGVLALLSMILRP